MSAARLDPQNGPNVTPGESSCTDCWDTGHELFVQLCSASGMAMSCRALHRVLVAVGLLWPHWSVVCADEPSVQLLRVDETGLAYRLGARAGDIISRYQELAAPKLEQVLERDDALRRWRGVPLTLQRGTEMIALEMPPGERGWDVGPRLPTQLAERAAQALTRAAQLQTVSPAEAERIDREVASVAGISGHRWWYEAMSIAWQRGADHASAQSWLEQLDREAAGTSPWARRAGLSLGKLYLRHGASEESAKALQRALTAARVGEPPSCAVAPLLSWADLDHTRGDLVHADQNVNEAKAIVDALAPDSLLASDVLAMQAVLAWRRGQVEPYRQAASMALALRAKFAPESLDHASALTAVGDMHWALGQLDTALTYYQHALEIHQRLVPGNIEESRSHTNFSKLYWQAGDYIKARNSLQAALEIQRRVAPDGLDIAWTYNNLGISASGAGDLPAARRYHMQALAIRQRLFPGSPSVAYSLLNLGTVLMSQGDYQGAREHLSAALAIVEKISAESLDTAMCLFSLAQIAAWEGDTQRALTLHQRSLALRERQAPGNRHTRESHTALGDLQLQLGNLDQAQHYFQRAYEIQQQLAPESADIAASLCELGRVAFARGDYEQARRLADQAERIVEQRSPGHPYMATIHYQQGQVARAQGRLAEARALIGSALEIFDKDRFDAGGVMARAYYSGLAGDAEHDLIDADVAAGDVPAGFEVLEHRRARGMLETMAEATIDWSAQLPPALRHRIEALRIERDRLNSGNSSLPPSEIALRLSLLENEQEEILDEVREVVPRFAELVYPRALKFDAMLQQLPPGGVLVAYSIGAKDSLLLALRRDAAGRPETRAVRLDLTQDTCDKRVDLLRGLVGDPSSGEMWRAPSRALGAELLGSLHDWLIAAQHLVVVPDGALHRLPFGLLIERGDQPLVMQLPVTTTPSLTMLAQLRARPERTSRGAWVGIGDPHYEAKAAPPDSAWLRRGASLQPLPGTRDELTRVNQLMTGARRLYLGRAATESCAIGAAGDAQVLHFACHGFTDDRFPLRSGLVLSTPSRAGGNIDDGVLQSSEVLERMRLNADLVVLSGCDTGGGLLHGGEGLMGLSRAFFGAGARSVVASQWAISDASTAELIERFYAGLRDGLALDVALQRAQQSFVAQVRWSHPYYWGAFQLVGAREPIPALHVAPHSTIGGRSAALIVGLGLLAVVYAVFAAKIKQPG